MTTKNQIQRNNLFPDYVDDLEAFNNDYVIVPSFYDIKQKVLRTLYGIDEKQKYNHKLLSDKSPKGSVDEAIRSLVDLINSHPSFATLSSCSGRIALFDPNFAGLTNDTNETIETLIKKTNNGDIASDQIKQHKLSGTSGKGHGAWIITSHGKISMSQLEESLKEHSKTFRTSNSGSSKASSKALIFKHEPLLLHIAASTLSRARQILTIALNAGFRESGMIHTPKRITVAIRSHSLSLTVPIASSGPLRPNREYLLELVRESNERFDSNEKKLIQLEGLIETALFATHVTAVTGDNTQKSPRMSNANTIKSISSVNISHFPLPSLNVWGHAAVAIPLQTPNAQKGDVELIVFGGYRKGSRSNKMYNLRRLRGLWDDSWNEIPLEATSGQGNRRIAGFAVEQSIFTAREGHAACVLPLDNVCNGEDSISKSIVAVFGGRASPARPNNELLLFSSHIRPVAFYTPADIRGRGPSARWGHSFVALGVGPRLAVVIGGRDESSILSSIHVLSLVSVDSHRESHLLWEALDFAIPRYHHSSVVISNEIFVFGGIDSIDISQGVLESEENTIEGSSLSIIVFDKNVSLSVLKRNEELESFSMFGASACSFFLTTDGNHAVPALLRTGGVSYNENFESSLECLIRCKDTAELSSIPFKIQNMSAESLDLGQ